MPEKHYGSPNPQGERMTSKGEGSFPPRDRNRNCRRCGGWGWQNYDHDELALIDTIEELSQLVFGREFFLIGLGSDKPSMRFCPGCCGRERKVRDEVFLADCHEVDVSVHLSVLGLILQVLLYGLVGALVLVLAFQKNILHLRTTVLRALRPNEHLDCLVRKHALVVNSD